VPFLGYTLHLVLLINQLYFTLYCVLKDKIMQHKYIFSALFALALPVLVWAGNPDRQGEAGAYQLLMNPWSRSAGLHGFNISSVQGIESVQLNAAGLARFKGKTEINVSHMRYLVGAGMNMNAAGFAQKLGKGGNSAFGVSLTSVDFGDIPVTTETTPEGSGGTFSPSFFTFGVSYAKTFGDKVSVGTTVKFINEAITNASARGFAIDAGVQYVAGTDDRFKLGVSLRNIGSRMRYSGEGLTQALPAPNPTNSFSHTYYQRSSEFEMPSQLIIGLSNDWKLGGANKITALATFVSNAFSRDNIGAGVEAVIGQNLMFRAAYKYEFGVTNSDLTSSVDNGIAAGLSFGIPSKKRDSLRKVWFDYGYRSTITWNGMHNLSMRITL
jgi:Type IX secretion system protein PorV